MKFVGDSIKDPTYEVKVNGQIQKYVVAADEDAGTATILETHWSTGELIPDSTNPHGYRSLEIKGKVEIKKIKSDPPYTNPYSGFDPSTGNPYDHFLSIEDVAEKNLHQGKVDEILGSRSRFVAELLGVKPNYTERLILDSKHQLNVVRAYRRSGKTTSLAMVALYQSMVCSHHDTLVVEHTGCRKGKGVIGAIKDILSNNDWSIPFISYLSDHQIKFTNGSFIYRYENWFSRGLSPNAIGIYPDTVLVDEAANVSKDTFECITPIIKGDKYKGQPVVFMVSSLSKYPNVFNSIVHNPLAYPEWNQIHIPITSNPDYTEEDIDELYAHLENYSNNAHEEFYYEWLLSKPKTSVPSPEYYM